MATEEHKQLAQYIKEVHASLRKSSSKIGVKKAWFEHCSNKETLNTYAKYMEQLATTYWETNCVDQPTNQSNSVVSRIQWSADFCYDYFFNNSYLKFRNKEIDISNKMNISLTVPDIFTFTLPLKLLDVGSCYNPFKKYDFLDVLAIDLCPANKSVYQCDFLHVTIDDCLVINNDIVQQLPRNSYDTVTFCFLLEYIPNSDLRIEACIRAYDLLKPEGLLIINTPDSKHVGANSKLMKCWRYTLACIGFSRIKYEKYKHMHCLVFRKSLDKNIAKRWAMIHKELFMEFSLHIPQDFQSDNEKDKDENCNKYGCSDNVNPKDFEELPFGNCYELMN